MAGTCSPYGKSLLLELEIGWERSRGGQVLTWHRKMKEATRKLATVGPSRLPGWRQKRLST